MPHRFRYRLFWLYVDLDELDALGRRLRLFSHNRFNLLASTIAITATGATAVSREQALALLARRRSGSRYRRDPAALHAAHARLRLQSAQRLLLLSVATARSPR